MAGFANPEIGLIQSAWWEIPIRLVKNFWQHTQTSLPWIFIPAPLSPNGFLDRFAVRIGLPLSQVTGIVLLALLLVGYFIHVLKKIRIVELYFLGYIGLYSYPLGLQIRNLVQVIPFLFFFVLYGAHRIITYFKRLPSFSFHLVAGFFLLFALIASRHTLIYALQQRLGQPDVLRASEDTQAEQLLAWIDENTNPQDVVLSAQPYGLYLYGNRKSKLMPYSNNAEILKNSLLLSGAKFIIPSIDGMIAGENMMMGEQINIDRALEIYPISL